MVEGVLVGLTELLIVPPHMQQASALSQRMAFIYLSDFQKSTIGTIEVPKEVDWQIKLIKIAVVLGTCKFDLHKKVAFIIICLKLRFSQKELTQITLDS